MPKYKDALKKRKTKRAQKGGKIVTHMLGYLSKDRFESKLMVHFDWLIMLPVLCLVVLGLMSILSATSKPVENESLRFIDKLLQQPMDQVRLQFMWALVGLAFMTVMIYFHYQLYCDLAMPIYVLNILLLVIVLFLERGRGGVAGWFSWGDGRSFQPSEVCKIAIIVALASRFARLKKPIETLKELMPMLGYFGLPFLLIILQPDVGTALVYIAVFAGMLFISGTNMRIIGGLVLVAILAAVLMISVMSTSESDFRFDRLNVFMNPELDPTGKGMHATNSKIAMGSGGFWGKGLFALGNLSSLRFIPDNHTDFVYAVVGETFGFVGTMLIVLMFAILLLRMLWQSMRAQDAFGRYTIMGVMFMLLFHAMENIGMVIGLLPITGIPLSFISYGGTNLLSNFMGLGLVLNVIMRSRAGIKGHPMGGGVLVSPV